MWKEGKQFLDHHKEIVDESLMVKESESEFWYSKGKISVNHVCSQFLLILKCTV